MRGNHVSVANAGTFLSKRKKENPRSTQRVSRGLSFVILNVELFASEGFGDGDEEFQDFGAVGINAIVFIMIKVICQIKQLEPVFGLPGLLQSNVDFGFEFLLRNSLLSLVKIGSYRGAASKQLL